MLHVTNSLTGKREAFEPLEPGKVRMYVCGPTVYGLTHVGNARPAVFFDVVRRYLEYSGYQVRFVSNFTDVDDKIINRAREEGVSADEISRQYTEAYREDMAALGVRPPDHAPKVTEFIPQIVEFIQKLVDKGAAYVVEDGEVFFSVRGFQDYGKLSKKNIDDLRTGVRIRPGELKRDPLDFSLWKPQKAEDEPAWDSPWGKGRPGWHIECSVMSTALLGDTFDIHGGGIDLIHPHHENEVAQSEACTDKLFAKYWLHNNLLNINNEKMSKSLGNIFLNRDFIAKFTAETLRFMLLSGHYRSPIDFSESHIRDSQAALHRFYSTALKCQRLAARDKGKAVPPQAGEEQAAALGENFPDKFREAMDDDLNTAKVVGLMFEYVRAINRCFDQKGFKVSERALAIARQFEQIRTTVGAVLNLFQEDPQSYLTRLRAVVLSQRGMDPADIDREVARRTQARKDKDFKLADEIRNSLQAKGILLMDTPEGTDWDIEFT